MPKISFSPKLSKLLIILAVCFLLIFFSPKNFFNPLRGVFLRISYPFQKTFYLLSRSTRDTAEFLGSIAELKKENETLIRENSALSAEVASLKEAKNENEILREQLNLVPRKKFNLEASFVIGRDPQRLGSWILIDKGESSGIAVGMPVIVSEGILVGKVAEIYSNTAKVDLLTEPTSVVNTIDIETEAKGVVKGEYGLGIILDMVAQTDILNSGDMVVTSGLGGDLPKGLLIGSIQEVRLTLDKLFQQAILTPRIKYSDLDVVFIIRNK